MGHKVVDEVHTREVPDELFEVSFKVGHEFLHLGCDFVIAPNGGLMVEL